MRMGGRANPTDPDGKENWLLLKEADDEARPGSGEAIVEERPESVESGRDLDQIAADQDRVWQSNRAETAKSGSPAAFKQRLQALARKAAAGAPAATTARKKKASTKATQADPPSALPRRAPGTNPPPSPDAEARPTPSPADLPGARKGRLPTGVDLQLATLVSAAPRGDEWIHEIKFDGYRVLCEIKEGAARLMTRNGKDWTDRFPQVAKAAATLPVSAARLDGEVVVLLPDGTTSFQALQNALSSAPENRGELVFFVFDLLHLDGWNLRKAHRSSTASGCSPSCSPQPTPPRTASSASASTSKADGDDFFRQACSFALEGVISKRGDQPYRPGRGKDWLKVKCLRRQEFVIAGYTDPEGSRTGFGALLLAVHEGKELVLAGKVGTGFNEPTLRDLRAA